MAVAGLGARVLGKAVGDDVPAIVGDGRLAGVGKLVGESMTAGDGVPARSGALAHPTTERTSTLAIHAMRVILRKAMRFPFRKQLHPCSNEWCDRFTRDSI